MLQGVYYAKLDDVVCIVVVMDLQLPKSEQKHRKAVVLPNPLDYQCEVYSVLSRHIGELFNVHIFQTVSLLPIHSIRVDEKIDDLSAEPTVLSDDGKMRQMSDVIKCKAKTL